MSKGVAIDPKQFFRSDKAKATEQNAVYSTQAGDLRGSVTAPSAALPDGKNIRVGRESKGRAGKTVTIVSGLPLAAEALEALGSELKKRLGCGGAVVAQTIELQGDRRDEALAFLQSKGYAAKKTG